MKTETITPEWDWREDYVVCEHVAAIKGGDTDARHSGMRVCCPACYELGFLIRDIKTREEGKITVGTILTEEECAAERRSRISKRLRKSGLH